MRDPARETDLALEALERQWILLEHVGLERLDRDELSELAIRRLVHHPHPADAEHSLDVVPKCKRLSRPERRPADRWHLRRRPGREIDRPVTGRATATW